MIELLPSSAGSSHSKSIAVVPEAVALRFSGRPGASSSEVLFTTDKASMSGARLPTSSLSARAPASES